MSTKRAAWASFLILIIAFCALRAYRAFSFVSENATARPNVLIVSVCSLRGDILSKDLTPNLAAFFARGNLVFKNAFNPMGWTNIANFTQANIRPDDFFFNLYDNLGQGGDYSHLWRIPRRRAEKIKNPDEDDNRFEKDYRSSVEGALKFLDGPHEKPYFAVVHNKYLHYPMIDVFNKDAKWDQFLSEDDKKRVAEYLAHPEKFPSKLPLLLMLKNDARHVLLHPRFKNLRVRTPEELRKLTGLMTNPRLLEEWAAGEGFAQDLQILKNVYRANVAYLDQILGPFLRERPDTVVMFVADHGEAHMERGELTHGMSLWDEMLKVPVAVQFPGMRGHEEIDAQIDHVGLSRALREVVTGEARTPREFRRAIQDNLRPVIVARNCNNDVRGVRQDNRYKYFVDLRSGERYLFDLVQDPGETRNIAAENPGRVGELEAAYWQNLKSIGNVPTNFCALTYY